jgi:uncharacterized lipoprotein
MLYRAAVSMVLLVSLLAGCAQTRRYNVQVLNQTAEPITVGLAKEGGPFEQGLASPEAAALSTPSSDENVWRSTVVGPGRIADTRVEGKFDGRSALLVRVYAGKRTLSDVLSISRGSTERSETVLQPEPALNKLVVTRQSGRIQIDPVDRLPAAQPGK